MKFDQTKAGSEGKRYFAVEPQELDTIKAALGEYKTNLESSLMRYLTVTDNDMLAKKHGTRYFISTEQRQPADPIEDQMFLYGELAKVTQLMAEMPEEGE